MSTGVVTCDRGVDADGADGPAAARRIAARWLERFAAVLATSDAPALARILVTDVWWRDLLTFGWDLRTFQGLDGAGAGVAPHLARLAPRDFALIAPAPRMATNTYGDLTVLAFFGFATSEGPACGCVRLVPDPAGREGWKAWVLLTQLEGLTAHPETVGGNRPVHSTASASNRSGEPDVVVLGAGQCGLSVAARLERLGLRTVVLERSHRIGDNWRSRYPFLALHDPVWANHLPYLPFPSTWPVYPSGERVADWLEAYAAILDIDVRTGTTLTDCRFDAREGRWVLRAESGGQTSGLSPRHVVLAVGRESEPRPIRIAGHESFAGPILHSSAYRSGDAFAGTRAVVVGASTSAHDIAADLTRHCASVTMVQRSKTYVMSAPAHEWLIRDAYAEAGPPVEIGDMLEAAVPAALIPTWFVEPTRHMAEMDRELLAGLRAAGYAADLGPNDGGLYARKMAGYTGVYIEVGAGALIAAGVIAVVQGRQIDRLEHKCVVLDDGSALEADVIVLATGFQPLRERVRAVVGPLVAEPLAGIGTVDDHGERRHLWRRTPHPGFWIAAGNFRQARYYSRFLALQIRHAVDAARGD